MAIPRRPGLAAALFLLLAIAFLVRLPQIGLSVSGDEPFSILTADLSWTDMNRVLVEDFVHPPLHYYVLHVWFRVVGFGVQEARWISLMFGLAAVGVLYLLGAYLFEKATGFVAALLLGLSDMAVMYSGEARAYSMALFLAVLTSYLFVVAVRERRQPYWWAGVASAVLMLHTLYYTAFLLVAIAVHAVLVRGTAQRVPRSWWMTGIVAIALACLPWETSGILQAALHSTKVSLGNNPAFRTHWYTPITIVNHFNNGVGDSGLSSAAPLWSYFIGAILFTLPAAWSLRLLKRDPVSLEGQAVLFSLLQCALPIGVVSALGLLRIQFQPRYLLFCAPFYYLLVARGLWLFRNVATSAVLIPVVAYSAYGIWQTSTHPFNEDTSGALAFVRGAAEPGDCAVFLPEGKLSLQWRNDHGPAPPFRVLTSGPERDAELIRFDTAGCRRTWAVVIVAFNTKPRDVLARRLSERHELVTEKAFRKVQVMLYRPGR